MTIEEKYMKAAMREAKKAADLGEVPIGCVIVYQDKIIGRGYNRRMVDKNVLSHAEIIAIRKACRKMGDWRLEGCTMYVTLEPCPMCAGAIVQARIPQVVIGCMNPKAGCAGSVLDMLHEEGFNHQVETQIGILGDECSQMLKSFFKALRMKKNKHDGVVQNEGEHQGEEERQ
ncbi:MAG: tRNA adenosine(34) deaminase TadA [Lachnospiraceae bacterium]